MASTVGVKNPYRYRGYRYDTETGLYYLQSRYYNPEWCRFVNADSGEVMKALIEKGLKDPTKAKDNLLLLTNIFAYCSNNPVNRVDTNGFASKVISKTKWETKIHYTWDEGKSLYKKFDDIASRYWWKAAFWTGAGTIGTIVLSETVILAIAVGTASSSEAITAGYLSNTYSTQSDRVYSCYLNKSDFIITYTVLDDGEMVPWDVEPD